jgi:hypothetical protein
MTTKILTYQVGKDFDLITGQKVLNRYVINYKILRMLFPTMCNYFSFNSPDYFYLPTLNECLAMKNNFDNDEFISLSILVDDLYRNYISLNNKFEEIDMRKSINFIL